MKKIQKRHPGLEHKMHPKPIEVDENYRSSQKLKDKVSLITGGDSGIGHAVAVCFAKEGSDIAISYLNEHADAKKVKAKIEGLGRKCLLIAGDISKEKFCQNVIQKTIKHFGKLDVLVNNSGDQFPQKNIRDITAEQILKTFGINIFSYFFMIKAALPFLKKGSTIINTASVTAYRGSKDLLDYSSTKGAIVAFTRSLSSALVEKGIRVNGVAPGPIWTPLIVSTFRGKRLQNFGKHSPMKRAGEPFEVAPCYVFLASSDSAYMSGQFLHPNGGEIING